MTRAGLHIVTREYINMSLQFEVSCHLFCDVLKWLSIYHLPAGNAHARPFGICRNPI